MSEAVLSMKSVHALYQSILEEVIDMDLREFQVAPQQRLVNAMNFLYNDEQGSVDEAVDFVPEEPLG